MSSISNLNIVVQQGGSAQEMQPTRQLHPEQNQMVAAQQQADKALQTRSTVQQSGEMEKNKLEKDGSGKGRYLLRQKKKISAEAKDRKPTGRLLDTVA